jgi:hypothetical protein
MKREGILLPRDVGHAHRCGNRTPFLDEMKKIGG